MLNKEAVYHPDPTCDPLVRVVQVWAVVYEQILNIGEHFIDSLHANICDDAWVLDDVSQTILDKLRVVHFT